MRIIPNVLTLVVLIVGLAAFVLWASSGALDAERFEAVGGRVLDVSGPPTDHRPVVARFVWKGSRSEN